jgi:hypothetical protein
MRKIKGFGVVLALVSLVLIGGILEGGGAFASPGADDGGFIQETFDVSLTGTVNGSLAATLSGSMTVNRYDFFEGTAYCEIVSLDLAGSVGSEWWTVEDEGYCEIVEGDSYDITVYVAVRIYTDGDDGDDGDLDHGPDLISCTEGEETDYFEFTGVSDTIPVEETVDFDPVHIGTLCDFETGDMSGTQVEQISSLEGTLQGAGPPAVGGIVELGATSGGPDASLESSSGSGFNYLALAAGLAAAAVAVVAAGGWYARRRWQR